MLLRLPWLTPVFTPITLGFWNLIAMGAGALGSWLSGRSQSKQHQRQLASEERRLMMQQAAEREWRAAEQQRMAEFSAAREQRIRAAGAAAGLSPDLIELAAGTPAPGTQAIPRRPQQQIQTAGMPQGGGSFNFMDAAGLLFTPQGERVGGGVTEDRLAASPFMSEWALRNQLTQGGYTPPQVTGGRPDLGQWGTTPPAGGS